MLLFIGRGVGMAVALEGALKLKEISYIHAEGYAAGELKHGAIALIEEGVPVVAVLTGQGSYDKMLANVQEVRARGADTILLAPAATRGPVISGQRAVRASGDQAPAHADPRHGSAAAVLVLRRQGKGAFAGQAKEPGQIGHRRVVTSTCTHATIREVSMGFMDKMKAAAQDAATQAKKATSSAQTKMEEGQVRKKMDESAKKLGYLVYRERNEGTPAGTEADTLVGEMKGFEQKIAELQAAAQAESQAATPPPAQEGAPQPGPAAPAAPAAETPPASTPPTSASEPTGGDFKL